MTLNVLKVLVTAGLRFRLRDSPVQFVMHKVALRHYYLKALNLPVTNTLQSYNPPSSYQGLVPEAAASSDVSPHYILYIHT